LAAILTLPILGIAQDGARETRAAKKPAPTKEETAARKAGIITARHHAINASHQIAASQGYRQRDTMWTGSLPAEGFVIVPLQLYAGNTYYIVLGSDSPDADAIAASAFDPDRKLIKVAPDRTPGKLVLKVTPKKSGRHYFRIHQNGEKKTPIHCALTYIFK